MTLSGSSNRTPVPFCANVPNFFDSYGHGCEWYEKGDDPRCAEWGDCYEANSGITNTNCCYCKGGTTTKPPLAPAPLTPLNSDDHCVDNPDQFMITKVNGAQKLVTCEWVGRKYQWYRCKKLGGTAEKCPLSCETCTA